MNKYSEEIIRYPAVNEEGYACEVLERVTFARPVLEDGSLGEAAVVNRRFDLKTGEPLTRVSDTEFLDEAAGMRLQLS